MGLCTRNILPLHISGTFFIAKLTPPMHGHDHMIASSGRKKKEITDHANPEGTGPQRSKERGRRGSTGPPQPEQRRQKHHQKVSNSSIVRV